MSKHREPRLEDPIVLNKDAVGLTIAKVRRKAICYRRAEDGYYRVSTITLEGERVVDVDESRPMDRQQAEHDYRVRSGKLFHEVAP